MAREQQKIRALNKFKKLEKHLLSLLGGKKKLRLLEKLKKKLQKAERKKVYL
jgi:hypothetical protein